MASGTAVRMADVLDELLRVSTARVEVVRAADRLRPTDATVLTADGTKLHRETGWAPRRALAQTLADTLDACRRAVVADQGGPAAGEGP